MQSRKKKIWNSLFEYKFMNSKIQSDNVNSLEILMGYFVGPFGALLSSGIFCAYLNAYFTDVLFLGQYSESVKSFLTMLPIVSTIGIIIGNLAVGQLMEKIKTKAGKGRPLIFISSFTLPIACILLFFVPSQSEIVKMVWVAIAYNLYYSFAYPIYNTANSALIPVSTRNSSQRSLLASVTNVAALATMGVGSMLFPVIAGKLLRAQAAWTVAFVIVGIISSICCMLQYFFTRERVTEEGEQYKEEQNKISMKKQVRTICTEKYWWIIICFYFLFQISGAIKNTSMIYFCKYVVNTSFWQVEPEVAAGLTQALFGTLGAIPMAMAALVVWPLSNKLGKRKITLMGMFIGVIGGVIAAFDSSNMIVVSVGIAVKCLGSAPGAYLILAMIADVLDYIEKKYGFRCDGFVMSVYSSIMVASVGVAAGILNGLLAMAGFDSAFGYMAQVSSAKTAISFSYIWSETIAYGICFVLLLFFDVETRLSEEKI